MQRLRNSGPGAARLGAAAALLTTLFTGCASIAKSPNRAAPASPSRFRREQPQLRPHRRRPKPCLRREAPLLDARDTAPQAHADLWVRIRAGFAMPELNRAGRRERALLHIAPGVPAADVPARRALPLLHRRGARAPRPAHRARAAALRRERDEPVRGVLRAGRRAVAVHSVHRQAVQPAPELVGGQPARPGQVDPRGARLPAAHLRDARQRLVPRAGLVQLGRRLGGARGAQEPAARPPHRLPQPGHARRDAALRAQADRSKAHPAARRRVRHRAAGAAQPALFRHPREDPPDRPEAGRQIRRHDRRRVRRAERRTTVR